MRVLMISIGTRGDMEPFLAIGQMLAERGHQVSCAFPEQFRLLAEESGMQFVSLGPEFIELLESDTGKAALGGGGSGLAKFLATIKLAGRSKNINKELIARQYEIVRDGNPDRILYNGKAIYPVIWGLENEGQNILVSPVPYMHYVKNHTHVAFNRNFGPMLNRLTYALADFGLVVTVKISLRWLKAAGGISRKRIRSVLRSSKTLYTISPSLFPRPDYWPDNLQIVDYHQKKSVSNWTADRDLEQFVAAHDKLLFVTFGSMTNPNPGDKTKTLLNILGKNRIPAVINTASGGVLEPGSYDKSLFYFVAQIPYEWIFPKVYAVIHHGGSGTTHLALRHGCASMIIPHIIDQYAWNTMLSELGVGPKGLPVNKITGEGLESKILDLFRNQEYREKAQRISAAMRRQDLREKMLEFIEN